jgi:general secretion pathway protein G
MSGIFGAVDDRISRSRIANYQVEKERRHMETFDRNHAGKACIFRVRGFTLIEIMVVVVIMGIPAALVVPKLMGRTDDARIIAAKQRYNNADASAQALQIGQSALSDYGTGAPGPGQEARFGAAGKRMAKRWICRQIAEGPLGKSLSVFYPGVHGEVDVFSLGADGQPGGTGIDADIGSWEL